LLWGHGQLEVRPFCYGGTGKMADILFKCWKCSKVLCVSDEAVGMTLSCTDCQTPVDVLEPAIQFNCIKCNSELAAFGEITGTIAQCPNCQEMISVPYSNEGDDRPHTIKRIAEKLFEVQCPHCASDIELEGCHQDWSEQNIECPKCNHRIQFPSLDKEHENAPPGESQKIRFKCKFCRHVVEFDSELKGKTTSCPLCSHEIIVPYHYWVIGAA
jgi:DNA-directed RNA polymerase subunit RPC12/RpoP